MKETTIPDDFMCQYLFHVRKLSHVIINNTHLFCHVFLQWEGMLYRPFSLIGAVDADNELSLVFCFFQSSYSQSHPLLICRFVLQQQIDCL